MPVEPIGNRWPLSVNLYNNLTQKALKTKGNRESGQ